MSQTPCRFFNSPGGCRKGKNCTFAHSNKSSTGSSWRSKPTGDRRSPGSPSKAAPPGVCNFYWATGSCRREFECRFRHVANNEDATPQASSSSLSARAHETIAPFLTEDGLAKINWIGTDAFFSVPDNSLSPSQTHNHLQRFLHDDFRFTKTLDIYAFLIPLNSANIGNASWTPEDGQLLLTTIATGNGLLRINDILLWPSVTTTAGSSRTVLSFQRSYLPLLRFLSSDFVVKSTMSHLVNALYMRIMDNFETFSKNVESCMDAMITNKSFKDPNASSTYKEPLGSQIITSLATIFFECFNRFKSAAATYPQLIPIVCKLQIWAQAWVTGISSPVPVFESVFKDNTSARDHIVGHIENKIKRLMSIVEREQARIRRLQQKPSARIFGLSSVEGIVAALRLTFDAPGHLRSQGPRHDNDFVDIQDIRIAPTHLELISREAPFLPANFHDAPHHLPSDSMERLLDIQFRLLREELTAPLRTAIQLVVDDCNLLRSKKKTKLSELIATRGGKYRSFGNIQEDVMFNVYTNVVTTSLVPGRRGLAVSLTFDAPPGRARLSQQRARVAFWETGKRLMQGGLIAFVWKRGSDITVHLGVLVSTIRDITEFVKVNTEGRVSANVAFFDSEIELRILDALENTDSHDVKFLIESPVMFEAIRPFLESLRAEPESIPFQKYLVHRPRYYFDSCIVNPPKYALVPNFHFQLSCLFPPEAGVTDLKMSVRDADSVATAREALKQSRLDPSQADAVVDALTREVSLIQGPPGTGKSFTGVEILRVLLQHVQPILMIAFTNHALDHLLTSVLDAGITDKIVRLGSRSADERISKFSIEVLETVTGKSRLDRSFSHHYRELKCVEEEIKKCMEAFTRNQVTSEEMMAYLQIQYPEHHEHIIEPPSWILLTKQLSNDDDGGGWKRSNARGKAIFEDTSMYAYWREGRDLVFLTTPPQSSHASQTLETVSNDLEPQTGNRFEILQTSEEPDSAVEDKEDQIEGEQTDELELEIWQTKGAWGGTAKIPTSEATSAPIVTMPVVTDTIPTSGALQIYDFEDPLRFFAAQGFNSVPRIPCSRRPLELLLEDGCMWSMSQTERKQLHQYWVEKVRITKHQELLEDFKALRERHADALEKYQEGKDENRRQLLKNTDIVGCTTTGAAKLANLLKGLGPRILLVEEAGQVLEAHILGTLVPSIEHLILIGDPLQLRPTLNNFSLSVDSRHGSELYKFDMSLMERLSTSGFPMSQINVQRRMRPTISNLIRTSLYPHLIDHDLVKSYPNVRGFSKNVFFLNHYHRESGGTSDESTSRYNTFEVNMIKDMVLYLLRQGCYSQEGDIVVLCTYLGQLAKLRDALADSVAVVIDERDQEALADREEEVRIDLQVESRVEHVKVSSRVRLRTVDNYQGEEAKIVILSLVRNAGSTEDETRNHAPSIGFLKSENRTNVALSRAKEGLFILGNSSQLASRSRMWREVIEELEENDAIGDSLSVACHRHPEDTKCISMPGQLPNFAPDGGCLKSCDARLRCGHTCPYKCHSDDPEHVSVTCTQSCRRLCASGHPCTKECSQPCGNCVFPILEVELPCRHICPSVPCYLMGNLESVPCQVSVMKSLLTCVHEAEMRCFQDPTTYKCTKNCNGILTCCGRNCASSCYRCRDLNLDNNGGSERTRHVEHPCHKPLYCSHLCPNSCSKDHQCITDCKEPCRQECLHGRCKENCSTPCSPCQQPCTWSCTHHSCPLPCGSVCARLPCDKRCDKTLNCGHRCPSVCGEPCSIQICPTCSLPHVQEMVVDMIMGRSLNEITGEDDLSELLITLPKCNHTFTVETLDGVCGISDFYAQGSDGKWLSLISPSDSSEERRKPPSCPTCRSPITSPRYGRVFKSADLDILERNVISKMAQQLKEIQISLERLQANQMEEKLLSADLQMKDKVPPISRDNFVSCMKALTVELKGMRLSPTVQSKIMPSTKKLFTVSPLVASTWGKTVRPLMNIYGKAVDVASTRSAHIHAWEAAFSFLYEQEMDATVSDPVHAPRRPREHAMRIARMKVGQPQPRADKRFVVEAFWITIQIRFTLADLAMKWLKQAAAKGDAYPPDELQAWATYSLFILKTCVKDAAIAFDIAKASESRRQMTKSTLFIIRANLEQFRFNIEIIRYSGNLNMGKRHELAHDADQRRLDTTETIADTVKDHLLVLRNEDKQWLSTNFEDTAKLIVEEWEAISRSLRMDTFYQPVSLEEKMAIAKAFEFSHTGHFYNCPNGHTYVIGECGGATSRSSCPECGASIGGSNHTLDASNTRAMDFEEAARQQGAQRSPWGWGI